MQRIIRLPNGRACSLGAYVKSWRQVIDIARDNPQAQIKGFDHFPDDASRVLRELRFGMHDRINRHLPNYGRGRKWSEDWFRGVRHAANLLNMHRVIVRPQSIPFELRQRMAHRLTHAWEE